MARKAKDFIKIVSELDAEKQKENPNHKIRKKTVRQSTFEKWGSITHRGRKWPNGGYVIDTGQFDKVEIEDVSDEAKLAAAEEAAKAAKEKADKLAVEAKHKEEEEVKKVAAEKKKKEDEEEARLMAEIEAEDKANKNKKN